MPRFHRSVLYSSMVSALIATQSVSAQQVRPGTDPGESRVEVIEVLGRSGSSADYSYSANKIRADLVDIGQSISVITEEFIKEQAIVRLNDVTPFVAGANEFSVYNDITIRGFRNSDDRRVNGLRSYNNFWSQDIVAHVDRIEVIKGSAAAMFGDASPGGVVNMVTKKPLAERETEIFTRLGSYEDRYLAVDTTGAVNDAILYRLNVAREDSETFRDQQFNQNTVVAPSVTLRPLDGTTVNIDLVYVDSDSVLDRGQPNLRNGQALGAIPIEVSLTQPGDKLDYQSLGTTVSLDQRLTDNWALALAYNAQDYDEHLIEHRIDRFISDSEISLRYGDRDSSADVSTVSGYVTGAFTIGNLEHSLVVGVDRVERDDLSRDMAARGVAVADLTDLDNLNRPRDVASYDLSEPSWSPWGGTMSSTGIYVQDQITLGSWQLMLGLRRDDFDIESIQSAANGEVMTESSGDQISPRASLLYRLNEQGSVYASYITGFEPPATWNNAPQNGGPFDPQDSALYEVGYKQRFFGGRAMLTAALYQLTKENAIVWAQDESNPDLYVQRGQERARGFELELNGQLTQALSVAANYAYNDAEISEDPDPAVVGKPKEGAPKHSAMLWARYLFTNSISGGAGVEYVGDRHTFAESLVLPSYTLWSAGLFYEPSENLEVSLQGKNLTDETHWTGGYNFGRLFPGNPRMVSMGVSYSF